MVTCNKWILDHNHPDSFSCKNCGIHLDFHVHAEPNKLTQLETDRTQVYGDPKISHTAIGYAWRGILQNRFHNLIIPEIPADLVAELLAAFKLVRLTRPRYHQDSADDCHVYLSFSERFRKNNGTMESFKQPSIP